MPTPDPDCPNCGGSGKLTLFTSVLFVGSSPKFSQKFKMAEQREKRVRIIDFTDEEWRDMWNAAKISFPIWMCVLFGPLIYWYLIRA